MFDQKELALFRKAQLRETKLLQREEQKECAELIMKLKQEREQLVCLLLLCVCVWVV